jgi:hypothetical protein
MPLRRDLRRPLSVHTEHDPSRVVLAGPGRGSQRSELPLEARGVGPVPGGRQRGGVLVPARRTCVRVLQPCRLDSTDMVRRAAGDLRLRRDRPRVLRRGRLLHGRVVRSVQRRDAGRPICVTVDDDARARPHRHASALFSLRAHDERADFREPLVQVPADLPPLMQRFGRLAGLRRRAMAPPGSDEPTPVAQGCGNRPASASTVSMYGPEWL